MPLLERNNELFTVMAPEFVRGGHVWVPTELRWYRRRVTIAMLRQCGITGSAAQRAVEVGVMRVRGRGGGDGRE